MSGNVERIAITGNQSIAHAVRMARTQVIAAYPITPQTSVVEELAEMIADGRFDARFIHTESEHSSMAACIGASMTGARSFTATSSQGLALMHEMLHWATGARTPVVMGEVNRSLGAPWTILTDQSDSMAQRDTGWIQLYCASNQEIFDSTLLAFKVAEQVLLPAMVVLDAYVLSHCVEAVEMPAQDSVDNFLPRYETPFKLDPGEPHAFGGMMFPDCFMEQRFKIQQAMDIAGEVILESADELSQLTSRQLRPLHTYKTNDAEYLVLCLGTAFGAVCRAVDSLRERGVPAGGIRLWQYRPFPAELLCNTIKPGTRLAIIDRACSFGIGGPVWIESRASLSAIEDVIVYGFIGGIAGREISPESVLSVFEAIIEENVDPAETNWVEVRS